MKSKESRIVHLVKLVRTRLSGLQYKQNALSHKIDIVVTVDMTGWPKWLFGYSALPNETDV